MLKRAIISSISVGALMLSSMTPAFAYVWGGIPGDPGDPGWSPQVDPYLRILYPNYPGSAVRHDRRITSRDVYKGARRVNAPRVGYIRQYGQGRGVAEPDYTGRSFLPVRSSDRWDMLRNARRHRLGTGVRGGDWRILNRRGDIRRRPLGTPRMLPLPLYRYDYGPEASLPPSLVRTGGSVAPMRYANDRRPSRRGIVKVADWLNPPVLENV